MQVRFTPYSSQHPNGMGYAGPFATRTEASLFAANVLAARRAKGLASSHCYVGTVGSVLDTDADDPVVMNVYREDVEAREPLNRLRHHVTSAIERGEAEPIAGQPALEPKKRLALLMLPAQPNPGDDMSCESYAVEIGVAAHNITKRFGGYTLTHATGAWRNGEKTLIEYVLRYEIAMYDTPENAATLRDIATWAGKALRQQCVMIVLPNGDVEFVQTGED